MVVGNRSVEGLDIDGTYQHLSEVYGGDPEGETVTVVDDQPAGDLTTEGVPHTDSGDVERPDVDGQSTFADWGWSA